MSLKLSTEPGKCRKTEFVVYLLNGFPSSRKACRLGSSNPWTTNVQD